MGGKLKFQYFIYEEPSWQKMQFAVALNQTRVILQFNNLPALILYGGNNPYQ